jgi:hypothetical protein
MGAGNRGKPVQVGVLVILAYGRTISDAQNRTQQGEQFQAVNLGVYELVKRGLNVSIRHVIARVA